MKIQTLRACLTPFTATDTDALLDVFTNPGVRRYLLDDAVVSREWVETEVAASIARFASVGAGLWSVQLQAEPVIVGFVGFREFFDPPQLQLLYGLVPQQWGKGLATEVARSICDHAFEDLGFSEILAATDLPNQPSRRVLERLGMEKTKETQEGSTGTAFYRLRRPRGVQR